ncbi:hypothetical protein [Steroidobacter sp.]|uniref:hypothetical protein n=1 Tax=Steroidobacter sp. TaxID=1978227 RepID=UPI001A38EE71|nr:hypothetical protein [Steroidobacter sp.]MBL8265931.1 hypothetical protein [Steroidobacter sp.]
MSQPISPFESNPPSAKKILISVGAALLGAAAVLVTIILPAEYNIDPTRIGGALGLTALNAPAKTVQFTDVVGGNETYREVAIPDFGEPAPLPNPAVFQKQAQLAKVEDRTVTLQPGQQTEIKTLLDAAQVITFSWQAEGGLVYVDFHGHEPTGSGNEDFWVRYEEQQSGTAGSGSLVAPFKGEHGWFWLNLSEQPVTIKLHVNGYFDKIVDYGVTTEGNKAGSK